MYSTSLFLGFPVHEDFSLLLMGVRPELIALYIKQDEGMWLQEIEYQGSKYLGKSLGDLVESDKLSLFASNIHSFLKKLVPQYPYEAHPLILLPILQTE